MAKLKVERMNARELNTYIKARALKGDIKSSNYKAATQRRKSIASFVYNQQKGNEPKKARV